MGYRYPLAAVPPVLSALGGVLHPCAPFAPSVGGGSVGVLVGLPVPAVGTGALLFRP